MLSLGWTLARKDASQRKWIHSHKRNLHDPIAGQPAIALLHKSKQRDTADKRVRTGAHLPRNAARLTYPLYYYWAVGVLISSGSCLNVILYELSFYAFSFKFALINCTAFPWDCANAELSSYSQETLAVDGSCKSSVTFSVLVFQSH